MIGFSAANTSFTAFIFSPPMQNAAVRKESLQPHYTTCFFSLRQFSSDIFCESDFHVEIAQSNMDILIDHHLFQFCDNSILVLVD